MKKKYICSLFLVVVLFSLVFGGNTFATDDPEPWFVQPETQMESN